MAPDNASYAPHEPEGRAAALAEEVRQLRQLLAELQADLSPALQSSLRERSTELQRMGGELAGREEEAQRLRLELDAAMIRSAELEEEVERWRGAARRGVEEVAERARAAAERFEAQTDELNRVLEAVRGQLTLSRAEAAAASQAREEAARGRDAAIKDNARRKRRIGSLKARVMRLHAERTTLSWKIAAPLRWIEARMQRMLRAGARLRRKITRRPARP
jgi:hypothetical protein